MIHEYEYDMLIADVDLLTYNLKSKLKCMMQHFFLVFFFGLESLDIKLVSDSGAKWELVLGNYASQI